MAAIKHSKCSDVMNLLSINLTYIAASYETSSVSQSDLYFVVRAVTLRNKRRHRTAARIIMGWWWGGGEIT